jgi:uncharacterized peroxidase-related enzyme
MRLRILHDGHAPEERRGLEEWERLAGPPSDVSLALAYRPDFFGDPLNAWIDSVVRGDSEWSSGDRELMGSFTAHEHRCPFCAGAHAAIAAISLGGDRVEAVLEDVGSAPIDDGLRTTLEFIRKLVHEPAAVGPADADRVRAAGVSQEALEDAVQVCAIFVVMARFANAAGFEGTPEEFAREAKGLEVTGYAEWRGEGRDPAEGR